MVQKRLKYKKIGVQIKEENYKFIFEYICENGYEITQVYLLELDLDEFLLQKEEVELVKWLSFSNFKKLIFFNEFVPFPNEYKNMVIDIFNKEFEI